MQLVPPSRESKPANALAVACGIGGHEIHPRALSALRLGGAPDHVTLVDHAGAEDVPPGTKVVVAHRILDRVVAMLAAGQRAAPKRRKS